MVAVDADAFASSPVDHVPLDGRLTQVDSAQADENQCDGNVIGGQTAVGRAA